MTLAIRAGRVLPPRCQPQRRGLEERARAAADAAERVRRARVRRRAYVPRAACLHRQREVAGLIHAQAELVAARRGRRRRIG